MRSATFKALPVARTAVKSHEAAVGLTCLSEAVAEAEAGAETARAAGRAWAEGRAAAALTAPRGLERCLLGLPGMADVMRQGTLAQADAVADALKTPGHAVAVASLRGLVAQNGLLDQLRARGLTVRTPGE